MRVYEYNSSAFELTGTVLSNEVNGDKEELVEEVVFEYQPNQKVDIMFDITSFKGSDNRSVHPFGEFFGEPFDVYIDAPMLDIDKSRMPQNWFAANNPNLTADKLRADPNKPGRFIYTVDRYRDAERDFGYDKAMNQDMATYEYDKFGAVKEIVSVNQRGERKLLPFVKTSITANGNITISSDKEKVVFWEKKFKVRTEHIYGGLKYISGGNTYDVPKDAFIAFVRSNTGARIGVMAMYEDGKFELNLREEYRYSWEDDPIVLYYAVSNEEIYTKRFDDIKTLYDIAKRGETIVLGDEELVEE